MKTKWLYTAVLLVAGTWGLRAQEHVEVMDTVSLRPKPLPAVAAPLAPNPFLPYFLSIDSEMAESKEQRAARINQETYQRVAASVSYDLQWHRPPKLSNLEKTLLLIGSLFLTSPYQFPAGTVPYTPGGAPVVHPSSPNVFPQCIRLDYDFASGTYKQTMVKWDELEKSMARSFGGPYRTEPVPRMQFHSTDKLAP